MTNKKRDSLESAIAGAGHGNPKGRFGTFGGVFTPCVLTIMGVIMFMRTGYVTYHDGENGKLYTVRFPAAGMPFLPAGMNSPLSTPPPTRRRR